jgi:hypothetical protein
MLIPSVSAVGTIENPATFNIDYIMPLMIALLSAIILWKWMIPSQLSSLQVGFEIDDGLYEVHRLTKSRKDAVKLLSLENVGIGVALYMMAMTGVLLLIAELIFNPNIFYLPNLIFMSILVLVPVAISPLVTLSGQFIGKRSRKKRPMFNFLRSTGLVAGLIAASVMTLLLLREKVDPGQEPIVYALALLVFMAPTILAYGRIMGASWNMLMISKFRTWLGRSNPIDPDKVSPIGRFFSFILVVFLFTMPFTAINGIVTVLYVMVNDPANSEEVLNYGGILGHQVYLQIRDNPLLSEWEALKSLPEVLAGYLSVNIAIVGLAFIFELVRNLFLGGQAFGGLGGVHLSTPREIRSENFAQSKILYFAFAGFSGYTALLLILVCYKEFGDVMPYTATLENYGFSEKYRLLVTWIFIGVGQAIFLLTWVLSVGRFNHLRTLKFDLNPDERREGAILRGGGNWMFDLIDDAAEKDDIDSLRRFQMRSFDEDEAIVRLAKARAKMIEMALRGLWPSAIDEARKVLAQAGGDDDEARMIMAAGHVASRRLDAAREALHNLQLPEGYDEPELLAFITEWFDPWYGQVTDDDLWDWENNPCIDHLMNLMDMLGDWSPSPQEDNLHKDRLSSVARLSYIGLLRAQNMHDEAMEMALRSVRDQPLMVRPRIAAALCLIDKGDWHSAVSVLDELEESDKHDPRVKALANILGRPKRDESDTELEIALTEPPTKKSRRWIDEAPANPTAALMVKGGIDEALNANILIAAAGAVERKMSPKYSPGLISVVVNWGLLTPIWLFIGIALSTELGTLEGITIGIGLILTHHGYRLLRKQQRRVIRHRDQKAMIAYARRIKRHRISMKFSELPVGNHLLISGMLLTINGNVYDIGLPGWMVTRLHGDGDRSLRTRLERRANAMRRSKDARIQKLTAGWWLKRPKEDGINTPAMERLVGLVAYRGRPQMLQRKMGIGGRRTGRGGRKKSVMDTNLTQKGIPHNTIVSERRKRQSTPGGPRLPSTQGEPSGRKFGKK